MDQFDLSFLLKRPSGSLLSPQVNPFCRVSVGSSLPPESLVSLVTPRELDILICWLWILPLPFVIKSDYELGFYSTGASVMVTWLAHCVTFRIAWQHVNRKWSGLQFRVYTQLCRWRSLHLSKAPLTVCFIVLLEWPHCSAKAESELLYWIWRRLLTGRLRKEVAQREAKISNNPPKNLRKNLFRTNRRHLDDGKLASSYCFVY